MSRLSLSLRAKLLLALGSIALLLMAQSSLAYRNVLVNRDAAAAVGHTQDVFDAAHAVQLTVDEIELRYFQFLLTGRPESLTAYDVAAARYRPQLDVLRQLTVDNPPQAEHWRVIAADLDRIRAEVLDPGIAARERGVNAIAAPDHAVFTQVRAELAQASAVESDLLAQRTSAADRANTFLEQVLVWGTAATALSGLLVAWLLSRHIAQAIERLAAAAQAIAGGDLKQRSGISRRDEIGRAAAAFDQMADSLERDVVARAASEARYKHLVRHAGDIIYQADAQGRFTWVNPIASTILGYHEHELVGRHFLELIHPDDRTTMRRAYAVQYMRREPNKYTEFRVLTRTLTEVWIGQNVQLMIADDGSVGFQAIARDITDRKRAQLELASLQHQTATILHSTAEGIYGIDPAGRCTIVNPSAARLTGYTMQELTGVRVHELVHHTRADGTPYPDADCPAMQALRSGEPCDIRNEVFWRKDGTSFPVEYSVVPIRVGGQITSAVMSFRDVTDRRAVERMKDEFVAIVSHELRTPLTSIRGSLGLLAAGLLGPISDRATRMVEVAVSNTDRLVRLINDILDIERMDSGRETMDRQWTNARDLVARSVEAIRGVADAAHVEVIADADPIQLRADPDRLLQTLTNLVGNAIKFSEAGSTVEVRVTRVGEHAEFTVADRGRGIPEDKLESIFGRFEQVDASDQREKGGSGLGLAIARSIVDQHGGRIWAESRMGHGSTFHFTVPLPIQPPTPLEIVPVHLSPTVLVCDDDRAIVDVVSLMLAEQGYRAIGVRSSRQVLELAARELPAVILLDLSMPGMSGWDTLVLLKDNPATREIPVIILSGYEPTGNEPEGHVGWLAKPVSAEALLAALQRVLERVVPAA